MRATALVAASAALILAGCQVVPAATTRTGEFNKQYAVGVGDTMYRYNYAPEVIIDYTNGSETAMGGESKFSQEILYSGMSGGALRLSYREFADGLARPAFQQDANYDYQPGVTVSFKGAKLRVLNADNNTINYVIESGFSNERNIETASK